MLSTNNKSSFSRSLEKNDLRKTLLKKMAAQNLRRIEMVCLLETFCEDFAKTIGNYFQYSSYVTEHFSEIRERLQTTCDKIRKETGTTSILREPTPESDESGDSGTEKGEKAITLQILLGDELQSVLEPNVLFEINNLYRRMNYIHDILSQLEIGSHRLMQWGYTTSSSL